VAELRGLSVAQVLGLADKREAAAETVANVETVEKAEKTPKRERPST